MNVPRQAAPVANRRPQPRRSPQLQTGGEHGPTRARSHRQRAKRAPLAVAATLDRERAGARGLSPYRHDPGRAPLGDEGEAEGRERPPLLAAALEEEAPLAVRER